MAHGPDLRHILADYRTVAVVGLSPKPHRPSHGVARYLQAHGYRVVPVNPGHDEILGERAYPRLADIPEAVDVVDIFRRLAEIPPLVDESIAIGARVVWMQLGLADDDAAERARAAGIEVVMDRCMKIEHERLLGRD